MIQKMLVKFLLLNVITFSWGHERSSDYYKYYDPNTLDLPIPENVLQILDYIDLVDLSVVFKNLSIFNNTQCNQDFLSIFTDLRKNYQWPKVLLDSDAKMIRGTYSGNRIGVGNFDECLNVKPGNHNFTGQYCLINANDTEKPLDAMRDTGNRWFRRPFYHIGTCVPSTCPREYMNQILAEIKMNAFGDIAFKFTIDEGDCHTKDEVTHYTTLNIATICFLSFIAFCIILSTTIDYLQRQKTERVRQSISTAFSLISNTETFTRETRGGNMASMDGIRALSMLGVVYLHTIYIEVNGNIQNLVYTKDFKDGRALNMIMMHQVTIALEAFFFIAGVLTVYSFLKSTQKNGTYDPIKSIIGRYVRIMAPFFLLLLIRVGISDKLHTGPLYNAFNNYFKRNCLTNSLGALLLYDNLVTEVSEMCFQHAWYNYAYLHFFIASQLILVTAIWNRKLAKYLLLPICAASFAIQVYVSYIHDIGPTIFIDKLGDFTRYVQIITYMRATPWIAGMFLGFIFFENKTIQISKTMVRIGWFIFVLSAAFIALPMHFMNKDSYTQPWSAVHLALRQLVASIGLGWVVFADYYRLGGWLIDFLGWEFFTFYSKISFEIYLIHLPIMEFAISAARETVYLSTQFHIYHFFAMLSYSTLLAIVLAYTVTMPSQVLIDNIIMKWRICPISCKRQEEKKDINLANLKP